MNWVVKIITDEDGCRDEPYWHYVFETGGTSTALCSGQVFGFGEGCATYEEGPGEINCPACINIIKEFKKIKL